MRFFKNTITLTVLSSYQGSIDDLMARIEAAVGDIGSLGRGMAVEATITNTERMHGAPAIDVADPPEMPRRDDRREMTQYYDAIDAWVDTLPHTSKAFDARLQSLKNGE